MKKNFYLPSLLLLLFIFPVLSVAQTIAEKYNFDFKGEGKEQTWPWIQTQIGCFSYIDSTHTSEGGNLIYKISFSPSSVGEKNMKFIASCTIVLPDQINGDSCHISIKSKTREVSNVYFMVTAIDCNEKVISVCNKKIENLAWMTNVLSLNLMNGKERVRALRVNIFYFGGTNPEQQICLSDLHIQIDEKELGTQLVDNPLIVKERKRVMLNKSKIVKLSHGNDSTLLSRIDEFEDKKIIGLGECTHGSRELKTAFIQFSKNLIQNGNCKFILLEAPVDFLLLVDLYIQGIVSGAMIEKQVTEIMQMLYADYIDFMDFVNWIKKYNETSLCKVHLSGMDYSANISPYFYDYFLALMGKEKGRYYLLKLHDKKFEDILQYAHGDSCFKTKLGDENFMLFTTYMRTCIRENSTHKYITPDYRDFYMFNYTKQITDHLLQDDEKLIIHGHSIHLSNLERFDSFPNKEIPVGNRLKGYYGDKYYSISFQVGEGTFTQESGGYYSDLMSLPLTKPPFGSFEHLALKTKEDYFYYPSKYLDKDIVELLIIPRMARYQQQYKFHSVRKWCDAYVFIQKSTPLKNIVVGGIGTVFAKFIEIEKLIKELKSKEY